MIKLCSYEFYNLSHNVSGSTDVTFSVLSFTWTSCVTEVCLWAVCLLQLHMTICNVKKLENLMKISYYMCNQDCLSLFSIFEIN